MPVADYMAACLFDPMDGYYMTKEPFGRGGDFVTAPEISQMFGELAAIWLLSAWQTAGEPEQFAVAEIGPGRGTLMADMIRTWRRTLPEFAASASIFLIETSPHLTARQKQTLGEETGNISWIGHVDDLPKLPLFLIGNELFDAIPVHQFVKIGGNWSERMVGLSKDDNLRFMAGAGSLAPDLLPTDVAEQPDGTVFELAPAREALVARIADRITDCAGAALFFDYGHLEAGFGDTLQAVRSHRYEDVLASPGEADITSHVDFAALAAAVEQRGARAAFMTQGNFLVQMGILERAGRLGASADEDTRLQIETDVERLAGPGGMGELFKVMAIFRPGDTVGPFGL